MSHDSSNGASTQSSGDNFRIHHTQFIRPNMYLNAVKCPSQGYVRGVPDDVKQVGSVYIFEGF